MFKGTYSSSSSSDLSEDEDEGIMLAQLNRNKRSAPKDEVDDSDASVPSVQTEGVSSTSSDNERGRLREKRRTCRNQGTLNKYFWMKLFHQS